MAKKNKIEQLADELINLSPQESEQLAIVIKAKMMPEVEKQAGLLQNPQTQQMARPQQQIMEPGTARNMAAQGLLR